MPVNDLPLLRATAREAGRIAHGFFKRGAKGWEKPGDQGIVTEADLAVDAYLHQMLRSARPDYGWLSEETQDHPSRLEASKVFVVDPIDGTRSFANGEQTWAVSIAVVEHGLPTAAVVHLPARGKTYTAALGQGAWLGDDPIRASGRPALEMASVLANKVTMDSENWPKGQPPIRRDFRASLAYRLALVAEGRFDAMVTFRTTWEWDIAAGVLIAQEAGALATDGDGRALRFNSSMRQTRGVLVATPEVHAGLLGYRR